MATLCQELENLDGNDAPERSKMLLTALDREYVSFQGALDDFCAVAIRP